MLISACLSGEPLDQLGAVGYGLGALMFVHIFGLLTLAGDSHRNNA